MLSFSAEAFVFQFANQKYKDKEKHKYNFVCCFVGCETWSVTLLEEHRLWVFENKVLRRIFGLKNHMVTAGLIRLHNKQLYDLYSPNIILVIKLLSEMGGPHDMYRKWER